MVASSYPGTGDVAKQIDSRLRWLQPQPLTADFGDADWKTIQALGGSPPPAFKRHGA